MHLYPTFQIDFKWKMLALKTYYDNVLVSTTHFVQRKASKKGRERKASLCASTLCVLRHGDNL